MTTITGLVKARMLAIEGISIISGIIDINGHLILQQKNGGTHDAGYVLGGPPGPQGATGETGPRGFEGPQGAQGPIGLPSFVPGPRGLQGPPNAVEARKFTAHHVVEINDAYQAIEMDSENVTNVTIPQHELVALPVGCVLEVLQAGSGRVQLVEGSGVTLQHADNFFMTRTQYSTVALRQREEDIWIVTGDVADETPPEE